MKKCLIIVGGEYAPYNGTMDFDLVIACDRGFEYADMMGIKYDIVMGDFDSVTKKPAEGVPVVELPVAKDDTDTLFAVKYALERGFNDIYIICAFGGRLDHTIANFQTAKFIAEHDSNAHLFGKDNELHSVKDASITIDKRDNSYISVFSLSDISTGVTIQGTKFVTDKTTLSSSFPLGVSNEWISAKADISVDNGVLAVVISKKN